LAEATVLVLGDHGLVLSELSERIRRHGFRAVRAKTPQDALDLADERGYRFSAALVESSLAALDLGGALSQIRERAGLPGMVLIATGAMPAASERQRLREAGVRTALWQPVGDHALLFHLNRATSDAGRHLRAAQRVPTEWRTRVMVAGRAKPASVYSLSTGGAYLATDRPSMRGAELAVDLPLPGGPVSVLGRVVYTNVPGNLKRAHLPAGMGIAFVRTPREDADRIGERVAEIASQYYV
jgi:CheY-like chemotaxis protein